MELIMDDMDLDWLRMLQSFIEQTGGAEINTKALPIVRRLISTVEKAQAHQLPCPLCVAPDQLPDTLHARQWKPCEQHRAQALRSIDAVHIKEGTKLDLSNVGPMQVIHEAPAPAIPDDVRETLRDALLYRDAFGSPEENGKALAWLDAAPHPPPPSIPRDVRSTMWHALACNEALTNPSTPEVFPVADSNDIASALAWLDAAPSEDDVWERLERLVQEKDCWVEHDFEPMRRMHVVDLSYYDGACEQTLGSGEGRTFAEAVRDALDKPGVG
jgi:hypothetical protein